MTDLPDDRQQAVARLGAFLERWRTPRLQVVLLLVMSGGVGLALSFAMLRLGLAPMWLRYPLAGLGSYAVFLALLRGWAARQLDEPDQALETQQDVSPTEEPTERIGFLESYGKSPATADSGSRRRGWLDLLDLMASIGDASVGAGLLVMAGIVVVAALVIIVLIAPAILAEALLDAMLMAGLWRRLSRYGATQSLAGALRATYAPAAAVIVALGVAGLVLQLIVPGADSIGDVLRPQAL